MPLITEVPVNLVSADWSHETHTRSAGLHLSHVISDFEKTQRRLTKGEDFSEADLEAYRLAGFLFEGVMYDNILRHRKLERLGEFEKDGIIMTPDAVELSAGIMIETKCTWRSMPTAKNKRTLEDDFESWVGLQIPGYLHGLGLKVCELWAYFINGGYGADRKPKLRSWRLEYEEAELERIWRMMKNHAQWMKETGRT